MSGHLPTGGWSNGMFNYLPVHSHTPHIPRITCIPPPIIIHKIPNSNGTQVVVATSGRPYDGCFGHIHK